MSHLVIKEGYKSKLDLIDTEIAIKFIKDTFERELAEKLHLTRVSAPLFVNPETGLNDDLNGTERKVTFAIYDLCKDVEIVQSLAKWKRNALNRYGFVSGEGLYTDMNAIRRDEVTDNLHSVYVDQWDWERVIKKEERTQDFLHFIVNEIYSAIYNTQEKIMEKYPILTNKLPEKITFINSQDLLDKYPDKTDKEREKLACKEYGAIFIEQIGWPLSNGKPHDGRAVDYDDWKLNGDILVYFEVLDCALELSSMGIRVDSKSLDKQARAYNRDNDRKKLFTPYAKDVLDGKLPLTIGGGIGQSRLCMFMLNKMHVGEVQASLWNENEVKELRKLGIELL